MEPVIRAVAVYLFLIVIMRLAGKRTLAQITTFDFVLLLIVGEATQQALLGDDFSVTNAFVVITTLIAVDIGFSLLQRRFPSIDPVMESKPLLLLSSGEPIKDRLEKARVDESDILEAARTFHGIERLDQIKYAVLERSGDISVIPEAESSWRGS